jgi:hypothetical protein
MNIIIIISQMLPVASRAANHTDGPMNKCKEHNEYTLACMNGRIVLGNQ